MELVEDGVWRIGDAYFEWHLVTHLKGDFYPGLRLYALTQAQSSKLLHRYKQARKTLKGVAQADATSVKELDLYGMPETFRVSVSSVQRQLAAIGKTWEQACAELGQADAKLQPELPASLLISLLMLLQPKDPNIVFAAPRRDQQIWIGYDKIVRSMLPRVQQVVYRVIAEVPTADRETAANAIKTFGASIAMRAGLFSIEDPLPDLVYSDDGEELRAALETVGLTAYVGIMPRLMPIPPELNWPKDGIPWAIGRCLYVEIDTSTFDLRASGDRHVARGVRRLADHAGTWIR